MTGMLRNILVIYYLTIYINCLLFDDAIMCRFSRTKLLKLSVFKRKNGLKPIIFH